MKQPAWESMPVLDIRALGEKQLMTLTKAYDDFAKDNLEAIAGLAHDQTRKNIDDALSAALSLPDLFPIRELLIREPGLSARDIAPLLAQVDLDSEDEEDGSSHQTRLNV